MGRKRGNEHFTRRDFLTTSAAAGAGVALSGTLGPVEAAAARKVPTTKLGKTGEVVSILGFGGAVDITPRLLNGALFEGITYLDTAQGYGKGESEMNIGEILEKNGRRQECFIVTKSGAHEIDKFVANLHELSLKKLRTDYVDLYYLHDLNDPDRLDAEMKAAAEQLKKEKKIRFFGFSCHGDRLVETMTRAAEVGFVDVIMLKYNFRDYDNEKLNQAIDKCAAADIGLVAMKTQGGHIAQDRVDAFKEKGFNQHQATLKAVWADERIHAAVSHMTNQEQVKQNTQAARHPKMGLEERRLLEQYAAETSHLYCRGCALNCESCVPGPVRIADTLRYRMYHDNYSEPERARELFAQLPPAVRQVEGMDFSKAEAACPYGVPIGALMRDAVEKLA